MCMCTDTRTHGRTVRDRARRQYFELRMLINCTYQVVNGISIVLQVKMYIATTTALIFTTVYVTLIVQETAAGSPNIISRAQWGASAPTSQISKLELRPAPYVIIYHSTGSGCETQTECQFKVRIFQTFHMISKGWADIAYNFLVGKDGNVYEGRGWGKKGAHSVLFNEKSIGICIIGDYKNRTLNPAAVQAVADLIAQGVKNNEIKSDYKLLEPRQPWATACPADSLYTTIKLVSLVEKSMN